eukprot:9529979-Lingulodinium_polyedra.AAC.1
MCRHATERLGSSSKEEEEEPSSPLHVCACVYRPRAFVCIAPALTRAAEWANFARVCARLFRDVEEPCCGSILQGQWSRRAR